MATEKGWYLYPQYALSYHFVVSRYLSEKRQLRNASWRTTLYFFNTCTVVRRCIWRD